MNARAHTGATKNTTKRGATHFRSMSTGGRTKTQVTDDNESTPKRRVGHEANHEFVFSGGHTETKHSISLRKRHPSEIGSADKMIQRRFMLLWPNVK